VPSVFREYTTKGTGCLEVLRGLEAYFTQADAQRQPASPEEADTIMDEALRSNPSALSACQVTVLFDVNILVRANEKSHGARKLLVATLRPVAYPLSYGIAHP
jgi:hypothetical protein